MSTQLKFILSIALIAVFLMRGRAQDLVFSQFYAAPLQLNPAFAGNTFSPRIAANYRNQWPGFENGLYTSYALSIDQFVSFLNSGIGITVQTDNGGDGIYKSTQITATYAYRLQISDAFFVKWGVEGSYIQDRLDWQKLSFPDQISALTGLIDDLGNPLPSQEPIPSSLQNGYFDVGAGMLVFSNVFYGGVSIKHINRPDESILGINTDLATGINMRLSIHGGAEFPLGNIRLSEAFISPSLMYIQQGDERQVNGGSFMRIGSFYAGGYYRHTFTNADAVILAGGVKYGVFKFGYSYDFTLSRELTTGGGTGGTHEVSILVNLDESEHNKRRRRAEIYNDCFRIFR